MGIVTMSTVMRSNYDDGRHKNREFVVSGDSFMWLTAR